MSTFSLAQLSTVAEACMGTDETPPLTDENLDVPLADLGYDSLAVLEIITRLQDAYDIRVTDEEADSLQTARAIVDHFSARLAAAR